MADPVLDVRDLTVAFPARGGALTAVDGVSLQIAHGEILGVVGESGAGKSMTGMAILGLIEPPGRIAGGEIRLKGQRIDGLSDRALQQVRGRRIGAIFQDPLTSLNPLFSVGEQIAETMRFHRGLGRAEARAGALSLMREVGIPGAENRLDHFPHQFSGGMRQRIVIAMALAGEPELIIADEPTTALDVSIQAQITALLKRLCRERGMAVMLVTHDMGVIAETADRVAVMYAGRLCEIGTVEAITRRPRHPYTRGLMGSIPSLRRDVAALTQIPGAMPRLDAIPTGCAFHPRCPLVVARCRAERPGLSDGAGSETGSGAGSRADSGAACWRADDAPAGAAA